MSSIQQRNRGRDPRNAHHQRNRSGPNRSKGKGSNRSRHPRSRHNNSTRPHRRDPANANDEVSSAPPGLAVVEEASLPPIDEQRQIYAYARCVGMHCEVEQTGGRTLSGIFHSAHLGSQSPSPIRLQMLQDMKTGEIMTEDENFILKGDAWVQMRVPGLNLLKQDKKANAQSSVFGTDAEISGRTQIQERTLKTCDWLSGAGPGLISGLEDQDPMADSGAGVGKWDQFEANKDLKVNDVTYNENTMSNFYTTSLSSSGVTEATRMEVERIAQEIEQRKALRPVDTRDDEDRYSAVQRPAAPPGVKRTEVPAPGVPADASDHRDVTPTNQKEDAGGGSVDETEENSETDKSQPQVSTNTRAGLKKFQAECERQRKEVSTAAAAAAAEDAAAAVVEEESPKTPTEAATETVEDETVTTPTASESADTNKKSEEKKSEEKKSEEKKSEEKKSEKKAPVFKANAPVFKPGMSAPTPTPQPAPVQPVAHQPPPKYYNQQHGGYPQGPAHYPARGPYVPHAAHRPPLYHPQQRHGFPPASRIGYAPRGYPPQPHQHFMHNPGARPHTMPHHPRHQMRYSPGRGPAHNRGAMGGMHRN